MIGALPAGGAPRGGTLSGDIRSHKVRSEVLDDSRKIWVQLPDGYESNPDKHYPVLYTCDGASVFDARTATRNTEWRLDETAAALTAAGKMDEVIIVAVSNGGSAESRRDDYAPCADSQYGGGNASRYLKFLQDELKPMVDNTYRTNPAPETTGIMGSSLGGLFSLYAGFTAPSTFGLVGALSPSLWYAGKDMLSRLQSAPSGPAKVWIDMGTREENPEWSLTPVAELQQAEQILVGKGYTPGQNLFAPTFEGADHTNQAWSERAGQVLQALFPPSPK